MAKIEFKPSDWTLLKDVSVCKIFRINNVLYIVAENAHPSAESITCINLNTHEFDDIDSNECVYVIEDDKIKITIEQ